MKVGKRLSSAVIKQREHDTKQEANEAAEKGKDGLTVAATTQDSAGKLF